MSKVLVCHTEGVIDGTLDIFAVVGKEYPVIEDNDTTYVIIDEQGDTHTLSTKGTVYSDGSVVNVYTWFTVVEQD